MTMNRTAGLMALAGAGAGLGFLFGTPKGRSMMNRAKQSARGAYNNVADGMARKRTKSMVANALEEPHEDTVMAHAFQEAVS
jgi:hypothetical protein